MEGVGGAEILLCILKNRCMGTSGVPRLKNDSQEQGTLVFE